MINLFQVSSNDQSILYLGQVFGMVGSLLPVKDPSLLMGIMFKVLNTTALTVGALLVVYVVVVGLLKTAQEGEFLGKQWNSLWVPIRTVLGIAALFPTATGYSAIQVLIMWVVIQGIGAGDALWGTVLKYVSVAGSPFVKVDYQSLGASGTKGQMRSLFQSLVCQASAKATYPNVSGAMGSAAYFCTNNASSYSTFCQNMTLDPITPSAQVVNNKYSMGPDGACGAIQYCDAGTTLTPRQIDDLKKDPNTPIPQKCVDKTGTPIPNDPGCLACKAQRDALATIVPVFGSIAENLVAMDNQYLNFFQEGDKGGSKPSWVLDYCTAKNIPTAQCCVVGGLLLPCNPDLAKNLKAYAGTDPDSGLGNFTNVDPGTIGNLYMKYPLQAYLKGSDFINTAVGQYTAALVGAVSKDVQNKIDQAGSTLKYDWETQALSYGWMMAGVYYFKIAETSGDNQKAAAISFTMVPPENDVVQGYNRGSTLTAYRNNFKAAGDLVDKMTSANEAASPTFSSMPVGASKIQDAMGSSEASLLNSFTYSMTGGNGNQENGGADAPKTNPLVRIASFGYAMMIIAQALFAVCVVLIATLTAVATINPMVLGTGLTMNPFGEAMKALANFFGPFIVILITSLFSLGALLGIYVPLIPYMIFTMGAIGWLFAVIEAMVAGPIIALGILSPGGQHDILGRAEPALMMLFNLFLRPMLMVFGMMAAMLVSSAVINFVNSGFVAVVTSIMSNPGLFETILFISVYVSFIVTVLNKTFSLIYVIPEKILTWIGGPAVQYGEQEALGAAKQAVEGAAGTTSGAAKESGGSVGSGVSAVKSAKKEKGARADKNKPDLSKVETGKEDEMD
jgi:hypothetical protein